MARITYTQPVLQSAIDAGVGSWNAIKRIKTEMDSMVGSPADYTKLEAPFGLVAGTGQTFYNYVANIKANLDTTFAQLGDYDKLI